MRMKLRIGTSLALGLILSGCTFGASGPRTTIDLTMTDFNFVPNSFTVPAGELITLQVTNSGAVTHDLMIMKLGQELVANSHVGAAQHAEAFWEGAPLESGKTFTGTFVSPSIPGEYQVICGIAGHFEAGMTAKMIVVAAP